MRGFTLRALPVCLAALATGCLSLSNFLGTGAPAPAPTATHAYWQRATAVLAQKPPSTELKDLVKLVQKQTDELRELSAEGVDPGLVAAVDEVVRCEEEVIRIAATANNDPGVLRTSQLMAQAFADANRKASEAKKRLKALRGSLNDRYGGGFAG